jgi:hypothetical protein
VRTRCGGNVPETLARASRWSNPGHALISAMSRALRQVSGCTRSTAAMRGRARGTYSIAATMAFEARAR